jgi:hypothetical protein
MHAENLYGKTLIQLKEITYPWDCPPIRSGNLVTGCIKHAGAFDEMTNISKQTRKVLSEVYPAKITAIRRADFGGWNSKIPFSGAGEQIY